MLTRELAYESIKDLSGSERLEFIQACVAIYNDDLSRPPIANEMRDWTELITVRCECGDVLSFAMENFKITVYNCDSCIDTSYNEGYSNGYGDGQDTYINEIEELKNKIEELESEKANG